MKIYSQLYFDNSFDSSTKAVVGFYLVDIFGRRNYPKFLYSKLFSTFYLYLKKWPPNRLNALFVILLVVFYYRGHAS